MLVEIILLGLIAVCASVTTVSKTYRWQFNSNIHYTTTTTVDTSPTKKFPLLLLPGFGVGTGQGNISFPFHYDRGRNTAHHIIHSLPFWTHFCMSIERRREDLSYGFLKPCGLWSMVSYGLNFFKSFFKSFLSDLVTTKGLYVYTFIIINYKL